MFFFLLLSSEGSSAFSLHGDMQCSYYDNNILHLFVTSQLQLLTVDMGWTLKLSSEMPVFWKSCYTTQVYINAH